MAYFFDEPSGPEDEIAGADTELLRLIHRLRIVARQYSEAYRSICELVAAFCRQERE